MKCLLLLMGLSCPNNFKHFNESLPVLNMIVIGFSKAGKTSVVQKLAIEKDQNSLQDCSLGKLELDIGSFILQKKLKIVAFEVASTASKSWKYYYPNAHIIMMVVDAYRLMLQKQLHAESIINVLKQLDEMAIEGCRVLLVFNKMEQIDVGDNIGISMVMQELANFKHQISTIKCSALKNQNIDTISHSITNYPFRINL